MNAREMHYDFKQKLNKIDSQQNRNLLVPEIDWKLNEAQDLLVKMIANPRVRKEVGFEMNQRVIDDIRTIVIDQKPSEAGVPVVFDDSSFITALPTDYWFLVSSYVLADKTPCTNKKLKTRVVQHDDEHEVSVFDRSSFDWRTANIRFNKDGIRIFSDGFIPTKLVLSYLKEPRRIWNAQDFTMGGNQYDDLRGNMRVGEQTCELPPMLHSEIVDLAVFITAGDLEMPSYQLKQNKVKITN